MIDDRIAQLEERITRLESSARKVIDAEAIYTPSEVCEILKCGKSNVYDLLTSGALAVTKIGAGRHGFRVKGSDLSAFLSDRTAGGPSPRSAFKYLKASSAKAS